MQPLVAYWRAHDKRRHQPWIVINASPDAVYDAVSRPEDIAEWFSDKG